MIIPFCHNEEGNGEEYSSPSILDIFRWICHQTENEKYLVNSPQDIFNKIISDGDNLFPSCSIVLNKHLFNVVKMFNNVGDIRKSNGGYFKNGGTIVVGDNEYKLFYTKKVLKRNMAFLITDENPFYVWKNDVYNVEIKKPTIGIIKKCQIKIWP